MEIKIEPEECRINTQQYSKTNNGTIDGTHSGTTDGTNFA
jgi:hypothetical protein